MADSLKPKNPSRLKVGFYVWFRKNHNEIQRLITVEKYSQRALLNELKSSSFLDAKLAIELLNKYEKEIGEGNWKPIELELFGSRSWYEKLPSIQRAFYELRDPRATGEHVPLAKRKSSSGRPKTVHKKSSRGGQESPQPTTSATSIMPVTPAPTPVAAPVLSTPAPASAVTSSPFGEPSVAPVPTVSTPPVAAPAATKTPFVSGPKIVPKSEQLKQLESRTPAGTPRHF